MLFEIPIASRGKGGLLNDQTVTPTGNLKSSKVEYAPKHAASGILTFYMGKNTLDRKDFIMGNLVVPVEA